MHSRRDLLRWAAALPLAPFAGRRRAPAHVVVVGAGIAGLGAARALADAGIQVTVIEARNRLGGRILTDRSLGFPIDLGAAWIHGIENNPVADLALKAKLPTFVTDYGSFAIYDSGKPLSNDVATEVDAAFAALWEDVLRAKEAAQTRDTLEPAFLAAVKNTGFEGARKRALEATIASAVETEAGANLSALGLAAFDEDVAFEGDDWLLPQGYAAIVDGLAQGITVRLNEPVKSIAYDDKGVAVTTGTSLIRADKVVVTIPLGVLKKGGVTFIPTLPEATRKAIQQLNMGILNKVAMIYDQRFWPEETHSFLQAKENRSEVIEFFNFDGVVGRPVLVALLGGKLGRELESIGPKAVQDLVTNELRAMFGTSVTTPKRFVGTRWLGDPWSRGSYSLVPPGATMEAYDALSVPVADRVYLAGEHTHRKHPSTVHGALLSGRRAAAQVLGKGDEEF